MGKAKNFIEGKCYKIDCKGSEFNYIARFLQFGIAEFYLVNQQNSENLFELVCEKPIYANYVNDRIKRDWQFLGILELSEEEKLCAPRFFRQSQTNLSQCFLIIPGKPDPVPCKPEDCIGLNRAIIHETTSGICSSLSRIITGTRNALDEFHRLRIPGVDEPLDFQSILSKK